MFKANRMFDSWSVALAQVFFLLGILIAILFSDYPLVYLGIPFVAN